MRDRYASTAYDEVKYSQGKQRPIDRTIPLNGRDGTADSQTENEHATVARVA